MLWNIWDFPDKIYILLDDKTRKTFFAHMHESFGSASEGKTPYYANTSTVLLNEFVRNCRLLVT